MVRGGREYCPLNFLFGDGRTVCYVQCSVYSVQWLYSVHMGSRVSELRDLISWVGHAETAGHGTLRTAHPRALYLKTGVTVRTLAPCEGRASVGCLLNSVQSTREKLDIVKSQVTVDQRCEE